MPRHDLWAHLVRFAETQVPVRECGPDHFTVTWVLEDRGEVRGQPQIVRRVSRRGRVWVELICPLPSGPVSLGALLDLAAELVIGAPILVGGQVCVHELVALDSLTGRTLLDRMGQLAGEALGLRHRLRPTSDFSPYDNYV